ncbi:ABC-2 type transport system permease protein [Sanguibacter gelidistatuariae]|uniref:ABC-2 type transport system permease protein n=1 Tax=Sanguibacter gelidistatuariae TaxID=1814289 RepID=A0A1G6Q9E5_9MICO|nr:ABC transporter permease [Sanguibacter gelidistatuariae]SDC88938.1 ABC-2 type transport system permease protein [Sanguibacter gelidistatuariae]
MSADASSVSGWSGVRLVAGREIRQRIFAKSFIWSTVVLVVLILAGVVAAKFISQSEKILQVGVTSQTQPLGDTLVSTAATLGATVELSTVTEDAGRAEVADKTLDALVVGTPESFQVIARSELDTTLASAFSVLAQQAALADQISELGGDPSTVGAAVAKAHVDVVSLDPPREVDGSQILSGYIVGILLFISLQICGQMVAQGVVEEKTSRVVELLLATVRPWQLMAGKVLGIGAIGLIQVLVLVGAGAGSATVLGLTKTMDVNLGATALWVIVWFLVGFTMFALLFAAAGALVSRQEEVGSVTMPILMLMMAPYIVGVSIAPWAPDSPLVQWLSWLPFTSPLIMPIRVALGTVPGWQVAAVLAINIAVIPALVWFAGRIYSNAVLRTGVRVKLKDALRAG